jgi:fumarate reductase (CoM/CoB) subunit A
MIRTLTEHLATTNVEVIEEVTAISLLSGNGRVCGAAGLDQKGELRLFSADATVLATGGGTRVYDVSTNSSSGTGDGYAMAYETGATLIDMEQVQFHPTGAVYPYDARGRLVTEAVRGEGGVLRNCAGERFMARYDPDRMELSTRDVVARAIATEVQEGRGTPRGGVWLDVTHLPPEVIEARLPVMLEQFLKFGVDIRSEPMEVAPTAHHLMGGVQITPAAATSLPGLFACGEVAGGVHGANRLGGNALADTQVFGRRAGDSAGQSEKRVVQIDRAQVEVIETRLNRLYEGECDPANVRRTLQQAMWHNVGIFRTEEGLKLALAEVCSLSNLQLKARTALQLAECRTVQNMCTTASLIVRAALLRPESRGAHVRRDITQNWDATSSPYGHTFISTAREGIDVRGSAT